MRDRTGRAGRLTKRPDFVAAPPVPRFHTERITVQSRTRTDDGQGLRVGLTVTRKVGHATERNRVKRRLRTAVQCAAVDYLSADADIVVIGRRDILDADFRLLIDDLRRALRVVTRPKGAPNSRPSLTGGERRGTSHA